MHLTLHRFLPLDCTVFCQTVQSFFAALANGYHSTTYGIRHLASSTHYRGIYSVPNRRLETRGLQLQANIHSPRERIDGSHSRLFAARGTVFCL
jgi:hypothetical protein